MEKNNFKTVNLGKGVVEIYDFGAVKLHAYKTNDLITDECFLLEKGGKMFMGRDFHEGCSRVQHPPCRRLQP